MESLNRCLNCIAQPKLYSIEQSIALIFGLACLAVDAWAVVCTIHYFHGDAGARSRGDHTFGMASLYIEPLLAISIVFLLGFAFSTRTPDRNQ
jgi:hypothetical protein